MIPTWPIGPVGDIAKIQMGQSPKGESTNITGKGTPLLNGPSEFGFYHPVPVQWTSAGVRLANVGDILFCVRGSTTGRMNTADQTYAIGRGLCSISGRTESDSQFVRYALTATMNDLLSGVTGSVFPNLSKDQIAKHTIYLPPQFERRAITEILGALDDKIAANTKLTLFADQFLAAVLARITDDNSTIRLGDVATVNPESCKPVSRGYLRYIDISSVGQGTFDFPDISSWDEAPSRARRHVQSGDVLWSTVRPNRRSHALNLSDDPLLVGSTGLAILRPREVGFAYLYEATKTPDFTAYLENVAEGSAYPAVRANRFNEAPINWLPAAERESFEMMAAPLRKALHSLDAENLHLASVRDALLPQLMAGKLRVKDAEELVAASV